MKTKILIATIIISNLSFSQWSTSTVAESALYVCPGFIQSALTYDDGSSVIFGGLNESQYMQKLDPEGKKIWNSPIQIYNIPGLNFLNAGGIDDGQGGWFVQWGDHRNAEYGEWGAFNNAVYMQHIDKNGNLLWQSEGIKLADVAGGIKGGSTVNDGVGGCVIQMYESDFLRNGAAMRDRTWFMRYNKNGKKLWEYPLDTSTVEHSIQPSGVYRIGKNIFLNRKDGWYITDTNGVTFQKTSLVPTVVEGDTAGFNVSVVVGSSDSTGTSTVSFRVIRFDKNLDSLWSQEFQIQQDRGSMSPFYNEFLPDRKGGLFIAWPSFKDNPNLGFRLYRVTSSVVQFKTNELKVYVENGYGFGFNGVGEYGVYTPNDGKAYKVDTTGTLLWSSNFTVISDPSEAYFQYPFSDNNGGAIVTYWTTLGGIYAQHTGRKGTVGVITKVPLNENIPLQFELSQNYPNPFNPTTTIRFTIQNASFTTLKIYDVIGRELKTLINDKLEQGKYEIKWDGSEYASGIYFYSIKSGERMQTKKMLLVK
jgi:hypothetical protein